MSRLNRIWLWLTGRRAAPPPAPATAPPMVHVVLLDGTMSSLAPGDETNIGLTYRLLQDLPEDSPVRVFYEPGIQWRGLRHAHEVIAGVGLNRQIRRAYLWLALGYRPGDRIMLMGFSRGAYAVRSLAGLIGKMGLLEAEHATETEIERLYELYRNRDTDAEALRLCRAHCHSAVPIRFLGVYDTVRALGIRYPLIWRFLPMPHPYHSHRLGPDVEVARHALALDETRAAFAPVLWETDSVGRSEPVSNNVQQVWFGGSHPDVGGHLVGQYQSRPRTNVPLVWMLSEAQQAGLPMPRDWQARFPRDAQAPSVGNFRGWGKLFWIRRRRIVGRDPSEALHVSAAGRLAEFPLLAARDLRERPLGADRLGAAASLAGANAEPSPRES